MSWFLSEGRSLSMAKHWNRRRPKDEDGNDETTLVLLAPSPLESSLSEEAFQSSQRTLRRMIFFVSGMAVGVLTVGQCNLSQFGPTPDVIGRRHAGPPTVVDHADDGTNRSSAQSLMSRAEQDATRDDLSRMPNVSKVTTTAASTISLLDAQSSNVKLDEISASPSLPARPVGEKAQSTASSTELYNRQQRRCQLSSYSTDGIGHQMEGKLSCLATALALNWTYVHQVVDAVAHDQNAATMEDVFGLSKAVRQWPNDLAVVYNDTEMTIKQRELFFHDGLFYNGGRCYSHNVLQTKFRDMCDDATANTATAPLEATKTVVLSNDNCWDYFWCQNQPLPNEWWTTIVPILRQSLQLNHPSMPTSRTSTAQQTPPNNAVTVAIHVRLGDAGIRKMDRVWGALVLRNLYAGAQAAAAGNITLQVSIHSDGERSEVMDFLHIDPAKVDTGSVVLYCRGDQQATIQQAMADMITADILVASESSLTHTAALLRYPNDNGVVLHPPSDIRNRMSDILGWHLLRKSAARTNEDQNDGAMRLERCTKALSADDMDCQGWTTTDLHYWSNLISARAAANKRRF